jgi:SNF2 family DNA or RNA helicase
VVEGGAGSHLKKGGDTEVNEIKLEAGSIKLFIKDPADWAIAERIAGSAKSESPGLFEYTLSANNLQRIYSVFTGPKRPVSRGGSFFMDRERERLVNYNRWTKEMEHIQAQERLPVEPNGKFVPYAHQTKIIATILKHPYSGVFADCGLGKTGSMGRAIELALAAGEVMPGKILVSGPLSILETSWMDDLLKFTHLKAGILWSNAANKDLVTGDATVIHDFGPKPDGTISVKRKRQTLFKNVNSGQVLRKLSALERVREADWVKYRAAISFAINDKGEERPFGPVVGATTVKERTKALRVQDMLNDPKYDLFLINHDGVKNYAELLKAHQFAWVVVDESTKIKNAKSAVTRQHIDISWKAKRRNILTGTPNPNGLVDLWAQFYFLDRGLTLEGSMKDYLYEYFQAIKIGHFHGKDAVKYVIRSKEDEERLLKRVRRSGIFLKQRDCIDLPPRTDMRRVVCMSGKQEKAYKDMEEELVAEFKHGGINIKAEAVNVLSKLMKLRQITSGYIVGEDGTKADFDVNPKLDDLDEFIEELGDNKLVIACQFRHEIETVANRYKALGVAIIDGTIPPSRRAEYIREFQGGNEIRIMVLQPQAAAHGITLTAASHLLFLSLDYNFEYYYQTAKRIERIGQQSSIFVTHSLAALSDGSPTIDHDLMDVLAKKAKGRESLFNMEDAAEVAGELTARLFKRTGSRV